MPRYPRVIGDTTTRNGNRKGEWERANAYAEKGLLRERIGDLQGVSISLTNMSVIEGEQGEWTRAREHMERSLDIKQKIGDIESIARLDTNLSELFRERGDYARATDLAERIKNNNLERTNCRSAVVAHRGVPGSGPTRARASRR